MKKNALCLVTIMMATILAAGLSSCDSDDVEDNGNGNGNSNKHVVRMAAKGKEYVEWLEDSVDESYYIEYTYDSRGRVTRMYDVDSSYHTYAYDRRYQYGDNFILCEEITESTYSTGERELDIERHKYTLENGLIVRDSITNSYESGAVVDYYAYDDVKRLISKTREKNGKVLYRDDFVWEGNNLMELRNGDTKYSYSYSNNPWKSGMIIPYSILEDGCLLDSGYFGMKPQYLPSTFEMTSETYKDENFKDTYEYFLTDGLVTRIVGTHYDNNGLVKTSVMSVEWE